MRRATVTIGNDFEASPGSYTRQLDAVPALIAVVQAALREYLERRGFGGNPRTLRITPAKKGSGARDASLEHDRYLTGK